MKLGIHAQMPTSVLAKQRTKHQTGALKTLTWKQGRLTLMLGPNGMRQGRPTIDVVTRHWIHHHHPIQAPVPVTVPKLLSQLATEQIPMTAHQRSASLVTGQ
jgi:hypothetical protein